MRNNSNKRTVRKILKPLQVLALTILVFACVFNVGSYSMTTRNMYTYIRDASLAIPATGTIRYIAFTNNPAGDEKVVTELGEGSYTGLTLGLVNAKLDNISNWATLPSGNPYTVYVTYPSAVPGQWANASGTCTNNPDYANPAGSPGSAMGNRLTLVTAGYVSMPQNARAYKGDGRVVIKWDAPATGTPTGYRVYRRPAASEGAAEMIYERRGTPTSFDMEDTAPNGTNMYIVCAYNATGFGPHTDEIVVTPETGAVPVISSITPNPVIAALPTTVNIIGSGFGAGPCIVEFNGSGAKVTGLTPGGGGTTISSVTVPAGVTSGKVYVIDAGGRVSVGYTLGIGATNTAPNSPTSLVQYRSDGTTVIPFGGWTNQTTVVLKMSMSDPDNPDTLTPQAEVTSGSFTGTPNNSGSSVAYAGSAVTGTITVTTGTDGSYNWKGRVQDAGVLTSSWVDYNAGSPDFRVDKTRPVVASTLPLNLATSVSPTTAITATFTEAGSGINPASVTAANFTVSGSLSGSHTTAPNLSVNTVTFNQTGAFTAGETVTCRVTTGLSDIAGNTLAVQYQWTFTVATTPPPSSGNLIYEREGGIMMAYPNPFDPNKQTIKMLFGAATGEAVDIYVFDANANVIWQKKDNQLAGDRTVTWDGKTSYGEMVDNGIYFVRIVKKGKTVARAKILVNKK